jgi:hypothetical protein
MGFFIAGALIFLAVLVYLNEKYPLDPFIGR